MVNLLKDFSISYFFLVDFIQPSNTNKLKILIKVVDYRKMESLYLRWASIHQTEVANMSVMVSGPYLVLFAIYILHSLIFDAPWDITIIILYIIIYKYIKIYYTNIRYYTNNIIYKRHFKRHHNLHHNSPHFRVSWGQSPRRKTCCIADAFLCKYCLNFFLTSQRGEEKNVAHRI